MPINGTVIDVCVDCLFAHANGDISPDADMPPLGRLDGLDLALGGRCECPDGECEWDGECDVTTFSSSPCQGCGSYLAGERHALTYWTRDETPKLACAAMVGAHSEDRVSAHRGRETPELMCGRHAAQL